MIDKLQRREYGRGGALGVIIPPPNSTVEPELRILLPQDVDLFVTRMPRRSKGQRLTEQVHRDYILHVNSKLEDTAKTLDSLPATSTYLAHTGCSYLAGYQKERELVAALSHSGTAHVITAAGAISAMISLLGSHRISIVSPYPSWLNELALQYWHDAGVEVVEVVTVEDAVSMSSVFDVVAEEVVEAVRKLDLSVLDAVVLTGTGMPTLRAIELLAEDVAVPVISPNVGAAAWALEHMAGQFSYGTAPPALRCLERWIQ